MSIIKVKTKGQITLPARLREQAGLSIGDILKVRIEAGKITLTPQSIIDRRLIESLEDFRTGRSYGPFDSADEMTTFLHRKRKASKSGKRA